MSTDINDIDAAPVMARVTCPCGFEIVGADEENNRWAYEQHDCTLNPSEPEHWYDAVFSFWGWAIIAAIAWAVVIAVTR